MTIETTNNQNDSNSANNVQDTTSITFGGNEQLFNHHDSQENLVNDSMEQSECSCSDLLVYPLLCLGWLLHLCD